MSPLNISIGNLFPGSAIAVGNGASAELIPVAAWNAPINSNVSGNASHRVWRLVNTIGRTDEIYMLSGGFTGNAALSGGDMAMICRMPQLPIESADMWAEVLSEQNWLGGSGDWMGISVRHDQAAANYYSLWINAGPAGDWQLLKTVAGSETLLDSGTGLEKGPGHWYRLEVEGANLRAYADDVELASVTDEDITTVNDGIGFVGDGFELNQGFANLRGGPLPVPANPTFLYNEWVSNHMAVDGDNCFTSGTPGETWDANDAPGQAHNGVPHDIGTGTNGHYFEGDLGEVRRLVSMRTNGGNSTSYWKDVNVKARVLETDEWTTICALGVPNRPNLSGWHDLYMDTIMDARYVRVEAIPTTGDGILTNEVEFWCGDLDVPSMWFVDGVSVNHSDADRAWLFTGHYQEVNAHASLVHPSTTWSVGEVVGAVPWTVDGGYAYDGVNYHAIDLKAKVGQEETYIIRVSAMGTDGTKPVFGDENVAGEITIMATDGTSILIRARSDDYDLTVADATADMVIAIAGDQLYVDGSLITTLVNPTTNAGAQDLHIGGVWDAAGSGTVKACAIYNRQLTATEVASITTRMEAL